MALVSAGCLDATVVKTASAPLNAEKVDKKYLVHDTAK
jgi:hypothetical protein